jgi:hypothetical protein
MFLSIKINELYFDLCLRRHESEGNARDDRNNRGERKRKEHGHKQRQDCGNPMPACKIPANKRMKIPKARKSQESRKIERRLRLPWWGWKSQEN